MPDGATVTYWLAMVAAASPIWIAVLWEGWAYVVAPLRVSKVEIEAEAAAYVARYGTDAGAMALRDAHRAWVEGDLTEMRRMERVAATSA